MALIYRAIFEVEDPDGNFVERAPGHFRDWLRAKVRDPILELPTGGRETLESAGIEIEWYSGTGEGCSVVRMSAFEAQRDDRVEVKTTFTAIAGEGLSWAWVDLERWTPEQDSPAWIPVAPGLVTRLLETERARRGSLPLDPAPVLVARDQGESLAGLVLDLSRDAPLVVVSYDPDEGVAVAKERAEELARRLAGIAGIYVLGEGAVTSFSRAMHAALGEGMDVHSGAIRTYLPGAGGESDYPGRHRFIAPYKLTGRRSDLPALIIAPALFRRAVEMPPPRIWRASARELLGKTTDYAELLQLAEDENEELRRKIAELEERLGDEREDNTDLQRRNDDLARQLGFLRKQLRSAAPELADAPVEPDTFEPVLCVEVIDAARERLAYVEVHPSVREGAESLDTHGDLSWARRAWSALQALNRYAEMKADGTFDGGFLEYCEKAAGELQIPSSWVVPTETKATMENPRFRELRVLPVSADVDPSGRTLMEAHIRIEKGGSPSPRIHYYDDTRGPTGKIHIGWFGDHLDSWAKS